MVNKFFEKSFKITICLEKYLKLILHGKVLECEAKVLVVYEIVLDSEYFNCFMCIIAKIVVH